MEGVCCSLEEWDCGNLGSQKNRGDCNKLRAVLREVDRIYSTLGAFAAVLKDGTLVTWDHKYDGG